MYINTPFNYTGSKFKILHQILPMFDYSKSKFIDLFCGGGSVYANILDKYDNVIINDKISELIGIHKKLFSDPVNFSKSVKSLCPSKDDKEGYLLLREDFNNEKSPEKLWALMLSCTNNMMRFNKKLKFNQSFGKRSWNPKTTDKVKNFVNSTYKWNNKIEFKSDEFYKIEYDSNCMVYIDPPYTNTEAGYNAYWNQNSEDKLFKYILNIDNNGGSFMLSGVLGEHKNGKRSLIIDNLIDKGFNYKILNHNYDKVSRNKKSKNSKEIIIFNYKVKNDT